MTYDPQHPERGEPPDSGQEPGSPADGSGQAGQHGQGKPGQESQDEGVPGQGPLGSEPLDQDTTAGEQDTPADQRARAPSEPRQRRYQGRDRPRHARPPKSRQGLLVGAGILGMLALVGLITGLTVAFNQPSAAAVHPPSTSGTHLIRTFQFVGSRTSASFNVPSATTSAHYIYRCPRGAANFSARMQNTSGSDVQQIVNTSGNGGTNLVALHPRHPGSAYHLAVHTPCAFRVQVFSR